MHKEWHRGRRKHDYLWDLNFLSRVFLANVQLRRAPVIFKVIGGKKYMRFKFYIKTEQQIYEYKII